MHKLFFLFLTSTLALAADPYPKNSAIDIQHYRFLLELNDSTNTIKGAAEVTILFKKTLSHLQLDLVGKSPKGFGMEANAVRHGEQNLNFSHAENRLRIALPATIQEGDTVRLQIHYQGIPQDGLVIGVNKFGDRTFFGDNWPDRARHWLPTIDHPYDKASCEFLVIAPDHYQVIANGLKVEQTNLPKSRMLTHWREPVPIPTKVMVIGVARFAVASAGHVHSIPVETWVYPQNREAGFSDFSEASSILSYFNERIGAYAYGKLANVQSTTRFGGMENAGNIFYFENAVTGKKEREQLIAHEIAHQWFGDSASEADWYHVWLSEGFATYFTNLFLEHKYGRERLQQQMQMQRQKVTAYFKTNQAPVIDTTITNINKVLNTNSYEKGGWVLHMLRKEVGDEAFWAGIREYYHTYRNSNAMTSDFKRIMEKASGQDLDYFFDQWLRQSGHPRLSGTWKYDAKSKDLMLEIKQIQGGTIFSTPLEIGIKNADGSMRVEKVLLGGKADRYSFPYASNPQSVILDPNSWLLFEGEIRKK